MHRSPRIRPPAPAAVSITVWTALLLVGGWTNPARAQIETRSARTTRDQGSAVRLKASRMRINDSVNFFSFDAIFQYSVWPSSVFFVKQPFVVKQGRVGGSIVDAEGPGDLAIGAKWRFYRQDEILESFQLAVVGGVELPTGVHDETENGSRLPPMLQPGWGSTDWFAAFVLTSRTDRTEIDAELLYRVNTEKDGFEFGDVIRGNVAFSFRLTPEEFPETGVPDQINLVAELLSQWQDRHEAAGVKVRDSGGFQSFLAAGLQYLPPAGTSLYEIQIQLPLFTRLHGDQDGPDWVVLLGARFFI